VNYRVGWPFALWITLDPATITFGEFVMEIEGNSSANFERTFSYSQWLVRASRTAKIN
jgi:hypothetical protein